MSIRKYFIRIIVFNHSSKIKRQPFVITCMLLYTHLYDASVWAIVLFEEHMDQSRCLLSSLDLYGFRANWIIISNINLWKVSRGCFRDELNILNRQDNWYIEWNSVLLITHNIQIIFVGHVTQEFHLNFCYMLYIIYY